MVPVLMAGRSEPAETVGAEEEPEHMEDEPELVLLLVLLMLLVENLMLQTPADQIGDDLPLFGPGGLGLDSVDALQIVVALEKNYGLKIPDPAAAKL